MAGHWVEGLRSGGLYGVLLRWAHVASVEVILGRNGGHVIIRTGSILYFPPDITIITIMPGVVACRALATS